jgi:hypothetical protein
MAVGTNQEINNKTTQHVFAHVCVSEVEEVEDDGTKSKDYY